MVPRNCWNQGECSRGDSADFSSAACTPDSNGSRVSTGGLPDSEKAVRPGSVVSAREPVCSRTDQMPGHGLHLAVTWHPTQYEKTIGVLDRAWEERINVEP